MRRITVLMSLVAVRGSTPLCVLKRVALNSVANSLSKSGDSFAADADPALIRDAAPFSLKLLESLLEELPRHRGLLLAACVFRRPLLDVARASLPMLVMLSIAVLLITYLPWLTTVLLSGAP